MRSERYFIGYHLRGEANRWVKNLKLRLAKGFNLSWTLQYPPHITLFHPFETEDLNALKESLADIAGSSQTFKVSIPSYGHFDQETWFVEVEQKHELFELKKKIVEKILKRLETKDNDHGYATHFHITLAHKELTPETFAKIEDILKTETIPFGELTIDSFTLFRKGETEWEAIEDFEFTNQ